MPRLSVNGLIAQVTNTVTRNWAVKFARRVKRIMVAKIMVWLRYLTLLFLLCWISLFPIPVSGQTESDVQRYIESGQYQQAFELGREMKTADSLSVASEALARQIMLGESDSPQLMAKQARDLAQRALKLNPDHPNARLQFVVTDGFVARYTGDVAAWFKKLPQKSLEYIQAYRTDFPQEARGDALMGAWHLEIARKAGAENGEKWFGARIDYGKGFFEQALQRDPTDSIMRVNYAFALIALSHEGAIKEGDLERAKSILANLKLEENSDDLSQKMFQKAKIAESLFEDPDALKGYVNAFLEGEPT